MSSFNEELSRAGELDGMAVRAFQPQENKPPITLAQYFEALHRRDQSIIAWEQFFDAWDILLCPPSMTAAFPHCESHEIASAARGPFAASPFRLAAFLCRRRDY